MPHSYAETLTLTCANCGRDFDAEFWLIVDAAERPDVLAEAAARAVPTLAFHGTADESVPLSALKVTVSPATAALLESFTVARTVSVPTPSVATAALILSESMSNTYT